MVNIMLAIVPCMSSHCTQSDFDIIDNDNINLVVYRGVRLRCEVDVLRSVSDADATQECEVFHLWLGSGYFKLKLKH